MKRTMKSALSLLLLAGLMISTAQAQLKQSPSNLFKSVRGDQVNALNAGDGYMVSGDYWVTVKPMNTPNDGRLGNPFVNAAGGSNNYILLGGAGNWADPAGNWPSGFRYVNNFRNSPRIFFPLFKKDGWPGYVTGNPLRAGDASADNKGAGGSSRFMFAIFSEGLAAAKDATRNYRRDARFTDATRRHMIYEAGWPTTAGIDFKLRAHQFTLNEQNMNDFVLIEMTLTNTGNVDTNADGTFEATNNRIDGISIGRAADVSPTIEISVAGDRGCNCINAGRSFGYSTAANPYDNGNPMALWLWWANTPTTMTVGQTVPAAGRRFFGIDNYNQLMGYTDIWNTWNVIAVKKGSISNTNLNALTGNTDNKETTFGTHPIGEGSRKGWYKSVQWQSPLGSRTNSQIAFRNSTATWYADYGKTTDGSAKPANLAPNPAFFSGGTADDISTFVVGNPNARPNGDYKYASDDIGKSAFETPVWEPLWNAGATNGSDFYAGKGFSKEYTFGQFLNEGYGPFSLEPGESMTIVWVSAAGFRLDGLLRTMQAAEWSYKQGMGNAASAMPVPATPDMRVSSTTKGTALVEWTDVSSITPVSGYKIWKASQYKRTNYRDVGLRVVDNYHRQHDVTASNDALKKAVNPNFDYWDIFAGGIAGTYQPTEWGHYELIAKIPSGQLGSYGGAGAGYNFAFEDKDAITGFTYWYYVSAYREGQYTGPQGAVPVGHIESSNMNRNGRNGFGAAAGQISLNSQWAGTYPWATSSGLFPASNPTDLKNIGAAFTVTPPPSSYMNANDLITVTPNPYKITGLNDVRSDAASHNIDFLNMPPTYTLTILDVSGQIIFQKKTYNANNGKFTWDMFSKDGVEVASGLYIYVVEHNYGKKVGHFSILR